MPIQPRRRAPTTYSRKTTPYSHTPSKRRRLASPSEEPSSEPPESTPPPTAAAAHPAPPHPFVITSKPTSTQASRATSTRRRRPAAAAPPKKLTQLTLDLGQRLRHTCALCKMSYHPSSPDDVRVHTRFHRASLAGVEAPASLFSRVIWRGAAPAATGDDSVAVVTGESAPAEKRKVREMLQIVDSELGAAEITDDALWRAGRWKAYLFSSSRRVVGFLLAERIQRGYVARGGASGAVVMGEERPALLGVCRIWTAGEWRRRGVARRLLEEARQEFVYGLKVGRELVAFSQPTESGAALARGWWGELREVHGNKENGKEKAETDETEDKGERGEGWLVYVEQD